MNFFRSDEHNLTCSTQLLLISLQRNIFWFIFAFWTICMLPQSCYLSLPRMRLQIWSQWTRISTKSTVREVLGCLHSFLGRVKGFWILYFFLIRRMLIRTWVFLNIFVPSPPSRPFLVHSAGPWRCAFTKLKRIHLVYFFYEETMTSMHYSSKWFISTTSLIEIKSLIPRPQDLWRADWRIFWLPWAMWLVNKISLQRKIQISTNRRS